MDTGDLIKRIKNRDISRRDVLQGMSAAGLAVVMTPVMSQAAKAAAADQATYFTWGGYHRLDADAIALGLNAMIDGLWLGMMIDSKNFDREAAKRACRSYLASVFPAEFAAVGPSAAPPRRVG